MTRYRIPAGPTAVQQIDERILAALLAQALERDSRLTAAEQQAKEKAS